jgi:HlyD family secretion protein
MKWRVLAGVTALVLISFAVGTFYYFQSRVSVPEYLGWVEADFVFVSPDEIGRIETLSVREGDKVAIGSPLFTLDNDLQKAVVAENDAAVVNARQAFDRAQSLVGRNIVSQKVFEDTEAALRSAEAKLSSAKTRLDRRRMASPVAGSIQEVYFRVGELVQPGRPIVSILPPGNVKVRFFVPQDTVARVRIGEQVRVRCDGCPADIAARVSFISAQAEFTPPVIYSLDERARLVFRIEAIPERPAELRIGQPASVSLLTPPPAESTHASK